MNEIIVVIIGLVGGYIGSIIQNRQNDKLNSADHLINSITEERKLWLKMVKKELTSFISECNILSNYDNFMSNKREEHYNNLLFNLNIYDEKVDKNLLDKITKLRSICKWVSYRDEEILISHEKQIGIQYLVIDKHIENVQKEAMKLFKVEWEIIKKEINEKRLLIKKEKVEIFDDYETKEIPYTISDYEVDEINNYLYEFEKNKIIFIGNLNWLLF